MAQSLPSLSREITACGSCARLRQYCLQIAREKRRAYQDDLYWGKPVSGFGDPNARLLIVGLAPAAHGANRTGRVFTGDRSGEWLYRALHRAGFANQPDSSGPDDGLALRDAYITCVVKCAPPDNKPSPEEIQNCSIYLNRELQMLLPKVRVVIALGQIALAGIWPKLMPGRPKPKFGHGVRIQLGEDRTLLLSYHPSQQNTFTGRLTEPMFDSVFSTAKEILRT